MAPLGAMLRCPLDHENARHRSWDMTDQDLLAIYHYVRALGPAGQPAPEYVPPGQAAQNAGRALPCRLNSLLFRLDAAGLEPDSYGAA